MNLPHTVANAIRIKGLDNPHLHLRRASGGEIAALRGSTGYHTPPKDTLEDWRLICVRDDTRRTVQILLIGYGLRAQSVRVTSPIVVVDTRQNEVRTQSGSLYELGKPGLGDPPSQHLDHLLTTLRHWGRTP